MNKANLVKVHETRSMIKNQLIGWMINGTRTQPHQTVEHSTYDVANVREQCYSTKIPAKNHEKSLVSRDLAVIRVW